MNRGIVIVLVTISFSFNAFSQCSVCATCGTSTSTGCTWTLSSNSSTSYTVALGQKLCITGGTYTGSITLEGGTIVVSSGVTFNPSSFSIWFDASNNTGGTIEIKTGASSTMPAITYQYSMPFTLSNCGTLNLTGAITLQGSGTVNINNTGTFYSTRDIIMQGSNEIVCNSGTMTFDDLTSQSSTSFNNSGTVTMTGTLTQQGGTINVCPGSYILVQGNWIAQTGSTITGSSSCGAIRVKGSSTCQSCTVTGTVDICDSSSYSNSPGPGIDVNQLGSWGSSVTFCTCAALTPFSLPITLMGFKAFPENESVKIEWETAVEINNEYFTVEKSTDGISYQLISKVHGAGNTTEMSRYIIYDEKAKAGITYYRLSQFDYDGKKESFPPVAVEIKTVSIFPNPVVDNLNFTFYSQSTSASIIINDISGKVVFEKQLTVKKGLNTLAFDLSFLSKGMYLVKAETSSGMVYDRFLK